MKVNNDRFKINYIGNYTLEHEIPEQQPVNYVSSDVNQHGLQNQNQNYQNQKYFSNFKKMNYLDRRNEYNESREILSTVYDESVLKMISFYNTQKKMKIQNNNNMNSNGKPSANITTKNTNTNTKEEKVNSKIFNIAKTQKPTPGATTNADDDDDDDNFTINTDLNTLNIINEQLSDDESVM